MLSIPPQAGLVSRLGGLSVVNNMKLGPPAGIILLDISPPHFTLKSSC